MSILETPYRELRFRQMSFWWDSEVGERYSVDARLIWPDETNPFIGLAHYIDRDLAGAQAIPPRPVVRIHRVYDFHGNDVTQALFGTIDSFAIRAQAEELIEAVIG